MGQAVKYCPGCEKDLPIDRFYVAYQKNGKVYYMKLCKNCSNGKITERRQRAKA